MVSTRVLLRAACGFSAAAVVVALTPSSVNDARLPLWRGAAHWASAATAELLRGAAHHLAGFGGLPELLVRAEGGPAAGPAGLPDRDPLGPPTATEVVRALGLDPTGLTEALARYNAGDLAGGDTAATASRDTIVRTALEWTALHGFPPHAIGIARLKAFAAAHPDWPARGWLDRRIEEAAAVGPPAEQRAFFAANPPDTLTAKLAAVKLLEADGKTAEAAALVKTLWREQELAGGLEAKLKAEYGQYLDKADHKFRADRLLYKEQTEAGLRAAALAGPDVLALAHLRVAMIHDAATDKMFAAVPAALQADPAFLLARIQKLRRADKAREAAALMQAAPRDPKVLVNGDEWWVERRLIARKLLDLGDAKAAYDICVGAAPTSNDARIEAEFHAGWIALRFMNEPALAAPHFAAMAALATGPMSAARSAYWQGRFADSTLAPDAHEAATAAYERAAAFPLTYYGQLARTRLGLPATAPPPPIEPASGDARAEAVRVAELFFALGARDLAVALSTDAAQHLDGAAQAAALAKVIDKERDAHLSLAIGKLLNRRGIAITALAFPRYGVPPMIRCRIRRRARWSMRSHGRRAPSSPKPCRRQVRSASCR
jgi:soluble lytic murein transglycosylase